MVIKAIPPKALNPREKGFFAILGLNMNMKTKTNKKLRRQQQEHATFLEMVKTQEPRHQPRLIHRKVMELISNLAIQQEYEVRTIPIGQAKAEIKSIYEEGEVINKHTEK